MNRRATFVVSSAVCAAVAANAMASVNRSTVHGPSHTSLDGLISNTDLIAGAIAIELPDDLGWHPVNTNPADQLPAFTDGLGELGRNTTGLLNDFPAPGEAPKQVQYDFASPVDIGYINVFTGNIDHDERAFSTFVVNASTDGVNFNTVGYFQSNPSGAINQAGNPVDLNIRSTLNSVNFTAGELDGVLAVQFLLFSVGNTQGQMRDPYDGVNFYTGVDDTLSAAFVSPKVYEIDVLAASVSRWAVDANGDWPVDGNWVGGSPNAPGQIARFGDVITAPRTVTVAGPQTVGAINFNSAQPYTVQGASTITLDQTFGPAAIDVLAGNHTMSTPLTLNDNLVVTVAAGAGLNASGALMMNNNSIVKAGAGSLALSAVSTNGGLNIDGGSVRINAGAGTSRVTALNIAGGGSPTATLDITDNAFVVDYDVDSPLPTLRAQIINAYQAGAWDGAGITSSLADASQFGIAYAESAGLASIPAIFGPVDSTAVLLRYTRYGDANLDGTVNLADFNRLAGNFGSDNADWTMGDFNYDGFVNLADFNRLAANFGLQAGPDGPTPEDWSALAAAVPEPALAPAVMGVLAMLVRRRRR